MDYSGVMSAKEGIKKMCFLILMENPTEGRNYIDMSFNWFYKILCLITKPLTVSPRHFEYGKNLIESLTLTVLKALFQRVRAGFETDVIK